MRVPGCRSFMSCVSRWSGSHIRWGQPFRLRHVTTGKYLSLTEDKSLLLMDKEKADVKSTAFCFRSSKVAAGHPLEPRLQNRTWLQFSCFSVFFKEKSDPGVKKEVDGMGTPDIKYGDSVCYIQHVDTCLWLTYQTVDAKSVRMGGVQRKVWYYTRKQAGKCESWWWFFLSVYRNTAVVGSFVSFKVLISNWRNFLVSGHHASWRSHGRWAHPVQVAAWGESHCQGHPQHRLPLQPLHQVSCCTPPLPSHRHCDN